MSQVQSKLLTIEGKVNKLESDQSSDRKEAKKKYKKVANVSESVEDVLRVAVRAEQSVNMLSNRVERIDLKTMKGQLIIRGISETKEEDCRQKIDSFFKEKLEIAEVPTFQSVNRIGKGKTRPLSVKLLDPNQVGLVFKNVGNLKHKRNEHDKPYSIDKQLTETEHVARRRRQEIKKENHLMPVSHALDVESKGDRLYVDNKLYVPEIKPPSAKQVLLVKDGEKSEYRAITVYAGPAKEVQGSQFQAFAAKVKSLEEVRLAYKKVKEGNLAASHIPCGFRLFGSSFHTKQDFADDCDAGLGKTILDALKAQGAFNIAVYIVRHFDGEHIGPTRFDIVRDLTKEIISSIPTTLEYGQSFTDQSLIQALRDVANKRAKQPDTQKNTHIRNRGGFGGRGRRRISHDSRKGSQDSLD